MGCAGGTVWSAGEGEGGGVGGEVCEADGRYKGTATATRTVTWTAPALNNGGEFTETRQTAFTAAVGEVQVLN
ncbi:hypothetical protein ACFXJ6_04840 [Streptomyces sp. NPDC059218]|uniref:hypothetical protein n=1 Tax=unclassified Streptomyces TaxID=2593676 RepID=UPI0036BA3519